jgi:hypothetical protein
MRKEFQCDDAVELGVVGLVDDAHAAFAELLEDLVVRNRLTDEARRDNSSSGGRMKKASLYPH